MHAFFLFHLVIFLVITMSIDRTPKCAKCIVMKCRYPESDELVPKFCAMNNFPGIMQETIIENWTDPELERINIAWETLLKNDRLNAKKNWV